MDRAAAALSDRMHGVAPDATFEAVEVDRFAGPGTIAQRIRQTARRPGASLVFLGSQNAGRVVRSVTNVDARVAIDPRYDVYIVRHPDDRRTERGDGVEADGED